MQLQILEGGGGGVNEKTTTAKQQINHKKVHTITACTLRPRMNKTSKTAAYIPQLRMHKSNDCYVIAAANWKLIFCLIHSIQTT